METGLIMLLALLLIYMVPTIIAQARSKRNVVAILALNVILGWTLIGWAIALIWALMYEAPQEERVNIK